MLNLYQIWKVCLSYSHKALLISPAASSSYTDMRQESANHVTQFLTSPIHFIAMLSGLFETKLAQFYESAISQGQKPNIKIFHKIESVGTPSIERHDILFGNAPLSLTV